MINGKRDHITSASGSHTSADATNHNKSLHMLLLQPKVHVPPDHPSPTPFPLTLDCSPRPKFYPIPSHPHILPKARKKMSAVRQEGWCQSSRDLPGTNQIRSRTCVFFFFFSMDGQLSCCSHGRWVGLNREGGDLGLMALESWAFQVPCQTYVRSFKLDLKMQTLRLPRLYFAPFVFLL